MKLPFPPVKMNSAATIYLESGLGLDGAPARTNIYSGPALFNEGNSNVYKVDGKDVVSQARLIIFRNVSSNTRLTAGKVLVTPTGSNQAESYDVLHVERFYNSDGTVHHIELGLM